MINQIAKILPPEDFNELTTFEREFPLSLQMPSITKTEKKFDARTRIFAAGSCFADNIAKALVKNNYTVGPHYNNNKFRDSLGPNKDWMFCVHPNINPSNTYVHTAFDPMQLNQDIKIGFDLLSGKNLPDLPIIQAVNPGYKAAGYDLNYFTPLHTKCWSRKPETINKMYHQIYYGIADSLRKSDVYILTYGLAEYIQLTNTNLYACNTGPLKLKSLGMSGILDVEEATHAISETINNINKINKNGVIFISLSPVRLNSTASKTKNLQNIYQMGCLGKSILRVAIENAITQSNSSDCQNVFYIPSYEFVSLNGAYEPDQRHVSKEAVDEIIDCFTKSYFD